jgi:hypothetical protein
MDCCGAVVPQHRSPYENPGMNGILRRRSSSSVATLNIFATILLSQEDERYYKPCIPAQRLFRRLQECSIRVTVKSQRISLIHRFRDARHFAQFILVLLHDITYMLHHIY